MKQKRMERKGGKRKRVDRGVRMEEEGKEN